MLNKVFYLASPYSHKSKAVMKHRHDEVTEIAAELYERGIITYPPITVSAAMSKVKGWKQTSFEDWRECDLLWVSKCDGLIVAPMEGWFESVGVQAEIAYAHELNIPTFHIYAHKFNEKQWIWDYNELYSRLQKHFIAIYS